LVYQDVTHAKSAADQSTSARPMDITANQRVNVDDMELQLVSLDVADTMSAVNHATLARPTNTNANQGINVRNAGGFNSQDVEQV